MIFKNSIATALIIYRRPDHRWLLQEYVWQDYDHAPELPELHTFLKFWKRELEAPIHSVKIAVAPLESAIRFVDYVHLM